MKTHEKLSLHISGHEIRLNVEEDERQDVEKVAEHVTERMKELGEQMPTASQAKIATMIAFEYACELREANVMLDDAEKLYEELESNKQAIARLEGLLEKVDEALLA